MKKLFGLVLSVIGICTIASIASCASAPYKVLQTGDSAVLGQKTVFLDVALAPRSLAVLPLIDAGIYNAGVASAEAAFKMVDETKLRLMRDSIADAYAGQFGAELVRAAYPFGQDEIYMNYFAEAGEETIAQLAALCEENEAEVIVAVVAQAVCTGVGTFGIRGSHEMRLSLCVFDKQGQLLAQGEVRTPGRQFGATDTAGYGFLFDEGSAYFASLLQSLTVSP
ncbi:MAG: hypothetical protein LBG27_11825 [Spirochaetaceae bacterium]|jgi:hypothetical protein|nr:hypothetical protein [Spirochaetaceae bacterium]